MSDVHRIGLVDLLAFSIVFLLALAGTSTHAQDAAAFFKGKSLRLVIANGVGGGNDATSRLFGGLPGWFERHDPPVQS
jgi:tripartite-type tricarboxylate transporter receptor subunit TctC